SRLSAAGAGDVQRGFTRLEVLTILAVLGLLAMVALPALANNRQRSERLICLNNLRQIGQAYHQWGTEHSGRLPVRTPWCEGGLGVWDTAGLGYYAGCPAGVPAPTWASAGLYNYVWFQFIILSNELNTPKILVCPSDTLKTPATQWSGSPQSSLWHPTHGNKAVSYIIALDAFPDDNNALVSGDRNIRPSIRSGNDCSSDIGVAMGLVWNFPASFGLTSAIHVNAGNFLFYDGRVEELSSQGFARRVSESGGGHASGKIHYIAPD